MILLLKDDTVDIVEKTAYLRNLLQTCKSQHTLVCMMYVRMMHAILYVLI